MAAAALAGGPLPPAQLGTVASLLARNVPVREHTAGLGLNRFVRFINTVTAADVITYLLASGLAASVDEAVAVGNQLILAGLLTHAKDPRQPFKNKPTSLYRLIEHGGSGARGTVLPTAADRAAVAQAMLRRDGGRRMSQGHAHPRASNATAVTADTLGSPSRHQSFDDIASHVRDSGGSGGAGGRSHSFDDRLGYIDAEGGGSPRSTQSPPRVAAPPASAVPGQPRPAEPRVREGSVAAALWSASLAPHGAAPAVGSAGDRQARSAPDVLPVDGAAAQPPLAVAPLTLSTSPLPASPPLSTSPSAIAPTLGSSNEHAAALASGRGPVPAEKLEAVAGLIARNVPVREHSAGLVSYARTVTAADVITYLLSSGLAGCIEEAVAVGNQLILAGLLTHAKDPRQPFKNKPTSLYRLMVHGGSGARGTVMPTAADRAAVAQAMLRAGDPTASARSSRLSVATAATASTDSHLTSGSVRQLLSVSARDPPHPAVRSAAFEGSGDTSAPLTVQSDPLASLGEAIPAPLSSSADVMSLVVGVSERPLDVLVVQPSAARNAASEPGDPTPPAEQFPRAASRTLAPAQDAGGAAAVAQLTADSAPQPACPAANALAETCRAATATEDQQHPAPSAPLAPPAVISPLVVADAPSSLRPPDAVAALPKGSASQRSLRASPRTAPLSRSSKAAVRASKSTPVLEAASPKVGVLLGATPSPITVPAPATDPPTLALPASSDTAAGVETGALSGATSAPLSAVADPAHTGGITAVLHQTRASVLSAVRRLSTIGLPCPALATSVCSAVCEPPAEQGVRSTADHVAGAIGSNRRLSGAFAYRGVVAAVFVGRRDGVMTWVTAAHVCVAAAVVQLLVWLSASTGFSAAGFSPLATTCAAALAALAAPALCLLVAWIEESRLELVAWRQRSGGAAASAAASTAAAEHASAAPPEATRGERGESPRTSRLPTEAPGGRAALSVATAAAPPGPGSSADEAPPSRPERRARGNTAPVSPAVTAPSPGGPRLLERQASALGVFYDDDFEATLPSLRQLSVSPRDSPRRLGRQSSRLGAYYDDRFDATLAVH